jgi:flagella basal body P-ring formation protein FlgA
MANTFKNYTSSGVGTSSATVYTVPALTSSVTIGLNIANVASAIIAVDVQINGVYLVKAAPIPAGSALSVLDGKIVLEAGDVVEVTSDTASSADVILSVLEQS